MRGLGAGQVGEGGGGDGGMFEGEAGEVKDWGERRCGVFLYI